MNERMNENFLRYLAFVVVFVIYRPECFIRDPHVVDVGGQPVVITSEACRVPAN